MRVLSFSRLFCYLEPGSIWLILSIVALLSPFSVRGDVTLGRRAEVTVTFVSRDGDESNTVLLVSPSGVGVNIFSNSCNPLYVPVMGTPLFTTHHSPEGCMIVFDSDIALPGAQAF